MALKLGEVELCNYKHKEEIVMPEDEKLEDVIEEPEKKYSDQDVDEIVSKKLLLS